MESKRRTENNRINDVTRQIESYIRIDEATIKRFINSENNTATVKYNNTQITKLRGKNKDRNIELEELEKRKSELVNGDLDDELEAEGLKVHLEVKRKGDESRHKKVLAKKEKEIKSDESRAFYNVGRQSDRKARWDKKGADRSYVHFIRTCDNIPDYMKKKLKSMPSNKGYIWKSVYLYGDRPAERGNKPTVMFERQRGGILVIHETSETEYKIWHKDGKERKVLHSVYKRKNKNQSCCNLLDYVK